MWFEIKVFLNYNNFLFNVNSKCRKFGLKLILIFKHGYYGF